MPKKLILFLLLFFSLEAHVSQVAVMEEPHEFERSVRDAEFIVVVEKKLITTKRWKPFTKSL